jgi:general secretion pathway protein D
VADEETAAHITNVVSQLDRPAPQVLIKCVFLEVTYNKGSDIGVSGSYTKGFGQKTPILGPSNAVTGFSFPNTGSVNQGFNGLSGLTSGAGMYSILASDFQVTLRAIAEAGKVEVLSRPSVLARNNQQATITIGQQVPLISNVRYDTFGNQINGISYQNVGIILQVTPFITSDNMVEMVVAPQISSLADSSVNIASGTTNSNNSAVSAPIINIRSADTVVVTPNNQTVVIGGLMSNRKTDSTSKIPLLGDIPWLGAAFRRKVTSSEKTELLIFLTPTILRDPRELASMSEMERSRMQSATNAFSAQELDRYLDKVPPTEETPETKSLKPKKN